MRRIADKTIRVLVVEWGKPYTDPPDGQPRTLWTCCVLNRQVDNPLATHGRTIHVGQFEWFDIIPLNGGLFRPHRTAGILVLFAGDGPTVPFRRSYSLAITPHARRFVRPSAPGR
jgi:hypothetical protein